MPLPGVETEIQDVGLPPAAPDDISRLFVAVESDRGPLAPVEATSSNDLIAKAGYDQPWTLLHPYARHYFNAGGQRLTLTRVVGPGALTASRTLQDAGAVNTLAVDAVGPGEGYNTLSVDVDVPSAGVFRLNIYDSASATPAVPVEVSPDFTDKPSGVRWAARANYFRLRDLGAGGIPAATGSALALTGGDAKRTLVTDTELGAALDRLGKDLGPGQLALPGRVTAAQWLLAAQHSEAHNRVALLDAPVSTTSQAGLVALAQAVTASRRYAAAFAPWAEAQALTAGATEMVPWTAIQAGMIAATDRVEGPAQPAAGRWGIPPADAGVVSLAAPAWSDADRQLLNENGVNVALAKYGAFRTLGFRTLAVKAEPTSAWSMLSAVRVVMLVRSRAEQILDNHLMGLVSSPTAGRLSALGNDLTAMLLDLKQNGQLFGETPQDAFRVDTGPRVNPPAQLAGGLVKASLEVTPSPFAERLREIVVVRTAA